MKKSAKGGSASGGKTVFVAMSGGVDSSVAAGLLKKQGFVLRDSQGNPERVERVEVVGVFMKNWSQIPSAFGGATGQAPYHRLGQATGQAGPDCSSQDDFENAAKAAAALDIPLYVWNFEKEYKEQVFEYMLREYLAGRTPNPDAMCNKEIKFGVFFEQAIAAGADFVATGHYARITSTNNESRTNKRINKFVNSQQIRYSLMVGTDPNKDQSYFLWTLTQQHLARTLFPIGEYTKAQVRKLAREFGLPNAERRDSQGLCFVGKVNFQEFLKEYLPVKRGLVVTTSGATLGEHDGAHYYTIGQRHGLGFGGGMPYYVAAKDTKRNILVAASGRDNPALFRQELEIQDVNWISGVEPVLPLACQARVRYRQPLQACKIQRASKLNPKPYTLYPAPHTLHPIPYTLHAIFDEPQWAVAPGQSIVFYQESKVLGGGIIA